jgi:hypothetical protein
MLLADVDRFRRAAESTRVLYMRDKRYEGATPSRVEEAVRNLLEILPELANERERDPEPRSRFRRAPRRVVAPGASGGFGDRITSSQTESPDRIRLVVQQLSQGMPLEREHFEILDHLLVEMGRQVFSELR